MSRAIIPLFTVPPADDLGPAMQACTLGERAWVIAKIDTGADNGECARLAGFSASSSDVLKSTGYQIAHRERVQAAILEMSRRLMRTEGPKSIRTLVEIRDDKRIKPEVRAKAAVELLNRAGMSAVQESHLTVTHELSPAQLDQKILSLAAELGLGEDVARKMLIAPGDFEKNADAVDAEFEDVPAVQAAPEELVLVERKNELRRLRRNMTPEELAAHKAAQLEARRARAKERYAQAQPQQMDVEQFIAAQPHDPNNFSDVLGELNDQESQ